MPTKRSTGPAFTAEERAAMKERSQEVRRQTRGRGKDRTAEEAKAQAAKIAELDAADRAIAEKLSEIVAAAAPDLTPKLWYGMPGWARNGKILCFFQPATKFKTRYGTFGFNEDAALDEGSMWPTAFALTKVTATDAKKITALVKKAVG